MSKTNTFENDLLLLIFNNVDIALIGDAAGIQNSAAPGSLYVSIHTADPAEGGAQNTSEAAYTGYARIAVARSGAGWIVTGNSVSPAAAIDFGECTAVPGAPITHFGVGAELSGAGKLMYKGAVTPNITVAVGVVPRLKTTTVITED